MLVVAINSKCHYILNEYALIKYQMIVIKNI